ncbi:hypothetical protein GH733_018747 [Mirounga leonina]|nr:hypothetical protein GH733_018747 [Mirounga leonina]
MRFEHPIRPFWRRKGKTAKSLHPGFSPPRRHPPLYLLARKTAGTQHFSARRRSWEQSKAFPACCPWCDRRLTPLFLLELGSLRPTSHRLPDAPQVIGYL